MFKLMYLKDGIAKLNYDYYIWLDPSTRFVRHPGDIIRLVKRAPLHVPLWLVPEENRAAGTVYSHPQASYCAFLVERGVYNPICAGTADFFIVHHEPSLSLRCA